MVEFKLEEKIFDEKLVLGDDISKIFAKHVKQKIQDFEKELKKRNTITHQITIKDAEELSLKHFGKKLK